MNFAERFWRGVYTASNSFTLMTQHPQLLLYLGAAAPLYYIIQILFYNLPFIQFTGNELSVLLGIHSIHYSLMELTNWFINSALIFATFIYVFLINVLNAALIIHTTALIQNDESSAHIGSALRKTTQCLGKIFSWSVIFTLISLVLRILAMPTYSSPILFPFATFIVMLFASLWFLLTFFVLTSIVINNLKIIPSIKTSIALVRSLFVEIFGSQCWIALIAMLCYTPMSTITRALCSANSQGCNTWALVITGITVLLSYTILSAQTILKTFLFHGYYHIPQVNNEQQI